MKTIHALVAGAALATAASMSSAAVIVSENFESYADTAAMSAVWAGADGVLQTSGGNGGQYASHSAASVNTLGITAISPTATDSIRLTVDILDDAANQNKRRSFGLRNAAGSNLIELGMYNAPAHYAIRTAVFGAADAGWVNFKTGTGAAVAPVAGWHRFEALITTTGVTFTLDLNADGSIDSTIVTNSVAGAAGFNQLRFGGPSGQSSAGGGAGFDNIILETVPVPEPTSLGLLALGGLMLGRRRRA